MNLLMDPLHNPLTTRPIFTGWVLTMKQYLSGQFACMDDTGPPIWTLFGLDLDLDPK
jgi:hypothetical protein